MKQIKNFIKDENGTASVEYGLLAAILGVSLIAAYTHLSAEVEAVFNEVAKTVSDVARDIR